MSGSFAGFAQSEQRREHVIRGARQGRTQPTADDTPITSSELWAEVQLGLITASAKHNRSVCSGWAVVIT